MPATARISSRRPTSPDWDKADLRFIQKLKGDDRVMVEAMKHAELIYHKGRRIRTAAEMWAGIDPDEILSRRRRSKEEREAAKARAQASAQQRMQEQKLSLLREQVANLQEKIALLSSDPEEKTRAEKAAREEKAQVRTYTGIRHNMAAGYVLLGSEGLASILSELERHCSTGAERDRALAAFVMFAQSLKLHDTICEASIAAVGKALGHTAPVMTRIMKALEQAGAVVRRGTNGKRPEIHICPEVAYRGEGGDRHRQVVSEFYSGVGYALAPEGYGSEFDPPEPSSAFSNPANDDDGA